MQAVANRDENERDPKRPSVMTRGRSGRASAAEKPTTRARSSVSCSARVRLAPTERPQLPWTSPAGRTGGAPTSTRARIASRALRRAGCRAQLQGEGRVHCGRPRSSDRGRERPADHGSARGRLASAHGCRRARTPRRRRSTAGPLSPWSPRTRGSLIERGAIGRAIAEGRAVAWKDKQTLGALFGGRGEVAVCAVLNDSIATEIASARTMADAVSGGTRRGDASDVPPGGGQGPGRGTACRSREAR